MQADPFQNPFINDIFKPIMAADKLQVLRKDKECYDIFLLEKDLKVFHKDKRDLLLIGHSDEASLMMLQETERLELDDETIQDDEAAEGSNTEPKAITQQSSVDQDSSATQKKTKRRKKASNLSRQANRRTTPGAELSWITNLQKNRKI